MEPFEQLSFHSPKTRSLKGDTSLLKSSSHSLFFRQKYWRFIEKYVSRSSFYPFSVSERSQVFRCTPYWGMIFPISLLVKKTEKNGVVTLFVSQFPTEWDLVGATTAGVLEELEVLVWST